MTDSTGNETPLEQRLAATERLGSLASSESNAARFERAERLVSAHVDAYRNGTFVADSAVFHADAHAFEAVAPVADDRPSAVEQVTTRLVTADAASANASLTAAERANATYTAEVASHNRRAAVERHLTNARKAYRQGQSLRDSASGTDADAVRQRARASDTSGLPGGRASTRSNCSTPRSSRTSRSALGRTCQ